MTDIDRVIATVRNHRDSTSAWPQWANLLADEVEALRAQLGIPKKQLSIFDAPPLGPFVRTDDHESAYRAAERTVAQEGQITTLKPGTHRHITLRVYQEAWPEELTATEAGQAATPGHDRVTGGTRRTYDLSAMGLIERGVRGFFITERGTEVLYELNAGRRVEISPS